MVSDGSSRRAQKACVADCGPSEEPQIDHSPTSTFPAWELPGLPFRAVIAGLRWAVAGRSDSTLRIASHVPTVLGLWTGKARTPTRLSTSETNCSVTNH